VGTHGAAYCAVFRVPQEEIHLQALNILIVDDNREAAELFQELLEMQGHSVRVAFDGAQALAAAAQSQPGVFLVDLTLPDIHGVELARRLRASALPAEPLMVAVSGHAQASAGSEGEAEVFDHYLQKPVNFDKLERILSDHAAAP
jgi:CheY-like chemotaxis protein